MLAGIFGWVKVDYAQVETVYNTLKKPIRKVMSMDENIYVDGFIDEVESLAEYDALIQQVEDGLYDDDGSVDDTLIKQNEVPFIYEEE